MGWKKEHFSRDSDGNPVSETIHSDDKTTVKPVTHVLAEDRVGGHTSLSLTPGQRVVHSVPAVIHVSASGLFLHLHWGKDHSDGGTGQFEFYLARISQSSEQKHLERKQLFWTIFPPNQIFTDGEHDHLVLPYSWTSRTVCSVTFVWNCKEIKLRTVVLYILTVCLPDRTWVGLLWDLFWTGPRCHSDPGQLRSVSGGVLVDEFSENLPSSTCDWIPHPPPWMCYRPCHQPLPALCKIPVELFHQEPPAQNSLCASFTGDGPGLSPGEPHIQQVSENRFLDDTQVELHTG